MVLGIFWVLFLLAFILSFFYDVRKFPPEAMLKAWLVFAGSILLIWGIVRIKNGRPEITIGQDTINFVVTIIGATLAILAIILQK